ncbi:MULTISPECIES: hypothetical protein [Rhizobium]|uniref:Transmembrane protein n=1 Tax=Rhizobium leguminosarum bv. trifolii TaxID=386 RepID=A0A1C9HTC1_RHILT|nr:hypothetical protein [Rhizobium leguminosarum]MDH6662783.1 hypothetical protein [Rhizobium sophorae]AOO89953.1 hypothetical protein [Rhizobium leguminosarum bv. trifolii]MBA8831593.1 hypothetical protein [Rhizobium leguminosarum]MBA9035135.1 hypothetical protein [Rhizobium leguminosarum]MBB4331591.1 hypothetical protein [Rhizobium leguminosarum]
MVYDWSGAKVRRIRIFKTSVALVLGTAMAAIPLLFWAVQLRGF